MNNNNVDVCDAHALPFDYAKKEGNVKCEVQKDQLNSDDDDDVDNNIRSPVNYDLQPQYFGGAS